MVWLSENLFNIISLIFGTGGVGYAIITSVMNRKRYIQEVRNEAANADIRTDEFWKGRYDVLSKEMESKDTWWRERYDNLYSEFQEERKLNNEIIKNFRVELDGIRKDYEEQKRLDKQKYDELMQQYNDYRADVDKRNKDQLDRISQLEQLVTKYEQRLKEGGLYV